ncbi:MAG: chemotaxis protein CheX [candidate division Zixibacteria bacterium]
MSKNENPLKTALVLAVSRTLENMAFEQVELIEGDIETYLAERKSKMEDMLKSIDNTLDGPAEECYAGDEGSMKENEDSSEESEHNADSAPEQTSGEEELWASIPLLKPLRGEMVIVFPSEYAAQLTESIYGALDSDSIKEITVNDAIAEIINIIAGCFAQELLPDDKRFELGLPNTGWGEMPAIENEAISLSFDLGGHILSSIVGGEDFCMCKNSQQLQEKVS